jgi:predicted SAM-dependent methyltransferase
MPFPAAAFDVVVTSEVLEHLSEEEGQQALIEVHRVLKPNAVYLGTVPCDEDLKTSMCVCVRNAVCISIVGATSGHSHRNR